MAGYVVVRLEQELAPQSQGVSPLPRKNITEVFYLLIQVLELLLKQEKNLLISTNSDDAFFVLESSCNEISFQLAVLECVH